MNTEGIVVVYDGACPFCSNYVRLMRLRRSAGPVKLVDARSNDPIVQELQSSGLDLDEGMVVIFGQKTYYGKDAVVMLSALSDTGKLLGGLLAFLLRSPFRASILYPYMKVGRRITLLAIGIPRILGVQRAR
jgi:predicted DCC family thiol-disulfide oxidoreductase YuxK